MRADRAFSLHQERKFEDANISALRALELSQRACGPNSYAARKCSRLLFLIALASGNSSEAEKHLSNALRVDESLIAQYSKAVSPTQWRTLRDKAVAATETTLQVAPVKERFVATMAELDKEPDAMVVLWELYGDVLDQGILSDAMGDLKAAEQCFRRAIAIPIAGDAGEGNMFSAIGILMLVRVLEAQEKGEEIDSLLKTAEKAVTSENGFGENSDALALITAMRGIHEVAQGNYVDARAMLQQAIALFDNCERVHGVRNGLAVGESWLNLSFCSIGEGDPARAEGEALKASDVFLQVRGEASAEYQMAAQVLADLRKWHAERTWRSSSNAFSRQGRFVAVADDNVVVIRSTDATVSNIPLAGLCQEDQAFVRQWIDSHTDAEQDPFVDIPLPK